MDGNARWGMATRLLSLELLGCASVERGVALALCPCAVCLGVLWGDYWFYHHLDYWPLLLLLLLLVVVVVLLMQDH